MPDPLPPLACGHALPPGERAARLWLLAPSRGGGRLVASPPVCPACAAAARAAFAGPGLDSAAPRPPYGATASGADGREEA